jgi:pimeloyl-ACP methyl ester carboxylesterase
MEELFVKPFTPLDKFTQPKPITIPTMSNAQQRASSKSNVGSVVAATSLLAGAGLALFWVAYSRNRILHDVPLTSALDGELRRFVSPRAGELGYYVAGSSRRGSPPLVFIHSINAAASSYEMKPLFEYYARDRRVYALELPGFGFSNRDDRDYTPQLMRDAILDFLRVELKGATVDAVALSLSSEFLASAVCESPKSFRSLVFISPTGLGQRNTTIRPNPSLLRFLRVPFWRRPIFDLLTSRPIIRLFTKQSSKKDLPRDFVNYAYAASHQPNAEHAPIHFLAAKLFSPNIFETYRKIEQACLLFRGQDPFADYSFIDELIERPNWRVVSLDNAGALLHWDATSTVIREMDRFMNQ